MNKTRNLATFWLPVFIISLILVSGISSPVQALVWGTDASGYLTGDRSIADGELTGIGDWSNAFSISWNVSQDGDLFTYEYTLGPNSLKPEPSHFILEITEDSFIEINVASHEVYEIKTYSPSDPGKSNPGLPSSIYGVKFDSGSGDRYIYTLTSDRGPVWGNFYAKGGSDTAAWNLGLANPSDDILDYIVRPDGDGPPPPAVPEPSTLLLLGGGLVGLAGAFRKKTRG